MKTLRAPLLLPVTIASVGLAQTPVERPGFPIQLSGVTVNGGALVDLDGDPDLEFVVAHGSAGVGGFISAFDPDGTPLSGWPVSVPRGTFAAPAVGDIDGDGDPEVVTTNFFFGISGDVYAFHHDGTPVSGFPVGFGGPLKGVALGDLDADLDLEIVVSFNSGGVGSLYALQGNGTVLTGWPRTYATIQGSAPSIGDVDGDGAAEVFAPSFERIYGFEADGTDVSGFPFDPGVGEFINYNSITLADLDADGDRELVFATSDNFVDRPGAVWVVEHTGVPAAGWPRPTSTSVYAPPAVADLDGDGVLDVICGDQLLSPTPVNTLYAWDRSGNPLSGFPVTGLDALINQTTIADVDGDGELEVLHETNVNGDDYYAVDADGTSTPGWPLPVIGSSFNQQLSVGDVDGDGLLDIAGTSVDQTNEQTYVYMWTTAAAYDPALAPVPTHMGNVRRDGVADAPGRRIGIETCAAVPNSTGVAATLSTIGSPVVAAGELTLRADDAPLSSFGFFFTSRMSGFSANPGGSEGNLCLGGVIGRYVGPGEIKNSGTTGSFELALDLGAMPASSGFVPLIPGETWYFQAWYRDSVGGQSTSNFTTARSVLFF